LQQSFNLPDRYGACEKIDACDRKSKPRESLLFGRSDVPLLVQVCVSQLERHPDGKRRGCFLRIDRARSELLYGAGFRGNGRTVPVASGGCAFYFSESRTLVGTKPAEKTAGRDRTVGFPGLRGNLWRVQVDKPLGGERDSIGAGREKQALQL